MKDTYEGQISAVLKLLKEALGPFALNQYKQKYNKDYATIVQDLKRVIETHSFKLPIQALTDEKFLLECVDVRGWLRVLNDGANTIFQDTIDRTTRGYVNVLIGFRDADAHQRRADLLRLADAALYLLERIGAKQHADTLAIWLKEWKEQPVPPREVDGKHDTHSGGRIARLRKAFIGTIVFATVLALIAFLFSFSGILNIEHEPIVETISPDLTVEFLTSLPPFATAFSAYGLNPRQIEEIWDMLATRQILGMEDLPEVLATLGYPNAGEIFATMTEAASQTTATAMVVNATATAEAPQCYLEVTEPSINVRSTRSTEDNFNRIGTLAQGERVRATARSSGTINIDLWWVIDLDRGSEIEDGWVSSQVVREIDEAACLRLPRSPGS